MLFHVSEKPGIARFVPRPSDYTDVPVVWAITGEKLRNYLLPRECPRVTFFAGPHSRSDDIVRFMPEGRPVIAIESDWRQRVETARLYLYRFALERFELLDDNAGYFVSREPVVPQGMEVLTDLPRAIEATGSELRVLPDLWTLRDEIVASSLGFSMIRMRNAIPRPA